VPAPFVSVLLCREYARRSIGRPMLLRLVDVCGCRGLYLPAPTGGDEVLRGGLADRVGELPEERGVSPGCGRFVHEMRLSVGAGPVEVAVGAGIVAKHAAQR